MRARRGEQPAVKNGGIPGLFWADNRAERVSPEGVLADRQELSSNPLCLRFQTLIVTLIQAAICRTINSTVPSEEACGYAACKAVLDPDLERGGNTNVVVRVHPAAADGTVHPPRRLCRKPR